LMLLPPRYKDTRFMKSKDQRMFWCLSDFVAEILERA
jgi:hypothetical protein